MSKTAEQHNAENFDFGQIVESTQRVMEAGIKCGREVTEQRFYTAIRGLETAYRKAELDPQTKMPSYLTASIAYLMGMLPDSYANLKIQREKLERNYGRPEHDQDTRGNRLKAGS